MNYQANKPILNKSICQNYKNSSLTISVIHSPWKWAYVEPQIWKIQSKKNVKKFWRVPENGQSEDLKSCTWKPQEQFPLDNGLLRLNVRQLPNPPKMGERTVSTDVTLLPGLFHWQIGKSLKQSSSRFEQMPRNWQFKPPKIGQYTAPAVEIVLVRFKTSFLINKRHGGARILTQFSRQKFSQGAAKNISYKFVYPKNKEKNAETIGFYILFSITILHQ